ncbi:unnamed protein product [Medioppia subpectinata]|uniref:Purple acid phosphatase n=1 Tax=Medioppia subpectinata TaxID=1979941 RepID=A0A7R9KY19_9ACAR|nr:unnamed protein product [Medioppia subpectinata]CAG2111944.1 unnamed protein product [Medioppia subpectinata]
MNTSAKRTIRATLTGLRAGVTYEYKCQTDDNWSDVFTFKALSVEADTPLRVAIFGDLGLENGVSTPQLKKDVKKGLYDTIFHIGDIAYNLNKDGGKVGDDFMNEIQSIAASLPYQVCPGNHEDKRPMYCVKDNDEDCFEHESILRRGRSGDDLHLKTHYGLEDLFYKHGVDIQFYAHKHIYERSYPINDGKPFKGTDVYNNPKAPIHVITGVGGTTDRPDKSYVYGLTRRKIRALMPMCAY